VLGGLGSMQESKWWDVGGRGSRVPPEGVGPSPPKKITSTPTKTAH